MKKVGNSQLIKIWAIVNVRLTNVPLRVDTGSLLWLGRVTSIFLK